MSCPQPWTCHKWRWERRHAPTLGHVWHLVRKTDNMRSIVADHTSLILSRKEASILGTLYRSVGDILSDASWYIHDDDIGPFSILLHILLDAVQAVRSLPGKNDDPPLIYEVLA